MTTLKSFRKSEIAAVTVNVSCEANIIFAVDKNSPTIPEVILDAGAEVKSEMPWMCICPTILKIETSDRIDAETFNRQVEKVVECYVGSNREVWTKKCIYPEAASYLAGIEVQMPSDSRSLI